MFRIKVNRLLAMGLLFAYKGAPLTYVLSLIKLGLNQAHVPKADSGALLLGSIKESHTERALEL